MQVVSAHPYCARKLTRYVVHESASWPFRNSAGNISKYSRRIGQTAIADHITSTGHNIKWDHFEILVTGRSDIHYRIKESLLIKDENVGSEKLFLY